MSYDSFSVNYDRFVNWESRLAYEIPFLENRLSMVEKKESCQSLSVLDVACGTGQHVLALAQKGIMASGADFSAGMIERAKENATAAGLSVDLLVAGFGELSEAFRHSTAYPFDAILCLGNSLPHLLTYHDLVNALQDFQTCLKSGGLVLIQNRNFNAILRSRERWMEPKSYCDGDAEWLFLRFYDYEPDGNIMFNIVTLQRQIGQTWQQKISTTHIHPLQQVELTSALAEVGFGDIICYGDMTGNEFEPDSSDNLIVFAKRL